MIEQDDETTPVPQVAPVDPADRQRVKAITDSPTRDITPDAFKLAVAALDRQLAELRTAFMAQTQVLEKLHPMRNAANQLTELSTTQSQLAAKVDVYRKHGPGAEDANEALGRVKLVESKLYGSDLDPDDNGDIGAIRATAASARKFAMRVLAAGIGSLAAAAGAIIITLLSSARDDGALRNQIKANEAMIQLQQVQIQSITNYLYGPARLGGSP